MSFNMLAVNTPTPQTFSGSLLRVVDATTAPGNSPTSENVLDGMTTQLSPLLRRNATRVDLIARYGGCAVFGIGTGLTLVVPGSGLNLIVAAGHAIANGIIELQTGATIAVPDATSRVFIWIYQGTPGTNALLTYTTTTTSPGANYVYIGNCTTSGGNVTAVDFSGVVYIQGDPIRTTSDAGMPTDTLSATLNVTTKTAFNSYFWNGTSHVPISVPIVSSDPATPQNGDVWINSGSNQLKMKSGGTVLASSNPVANGANVASANNLVLGADGNLFHITGTTQINLLASTNFQPGSIVYLIFDGALTVKNNQGVSGVNKPILLYGGVDYVTAANSMLILTYDGTSWYDIRLGLTVSGTGTVTSVAMTVPAEFSVSGSPITTNGTLAISKVAQGANLVYAGPISAGPTNPTFRSLNPVDIPALDASKITSGSFNTTIAPGAPGSVNWAATATGTFSNSSTGNLFSNRPHILANSLSVGDSFRISAYGVYSAKAVAPGTLAFRLQLASVVLGTSATLALLASASNKSWGLQADITVVSIGATGTFEVQGMAFLESVAGIITNAPMSNTAVITIDTTANMDIFVGQIFSVADASNSVTLRSYTVQKFVGGGYNTGVGAIPVYV